MDNDASDEDSRTPTLARRSPFVLSVKFCPRCLSPLKPANELGGWLVPQTYICPKCGYSGSVFLEKGPEPDKGEK